MVALLSRNNHPIEQEPKVLKKRGRKLKTKTLEPKVPKKRGRPKKLVAATADFATFMVTSPTKKAKPKKKIAAKPKVKVKKRAVSKPAPQKKLAEKVESVPTVVPTLKGKKKVAKKKVTKKRKPNVISLVNLRKPLVKKEPIVESEHVVEPVPVVEPIVTTTEEPKE